jgi:hypothetical protein
MAVCDKDTVLNNNLIDLIARLHDRFHFLPFVLMAERQRQARFSMTNMCLLLSSATVNGPLSAVLLRAEIRFQIIGY